MNDWRDDDVWQREVRDRVLRPEFYGKYSLDGRFIFVDQNQMKTMAERHGSVDTEVWSRRTCKMVRVEEKIIRPPKLLARFTNYLLETKSCTVPGRESPGWMDYSPADLLLYAFCTSPEETALDVHLLDMPELRAWFWPLEPTFEPFVTDQRNRTLTRKVPFGAVPPRIVVWRGLVQEMSRPPAPLRSPYFDDWGTFCHPCSICGDTYAPFGYDYFPPVKLGQWFCRDHRPGEMS